ncbi:hypothetical protein TRVA0_022S00210 [Trichomonascus vanleenenianus]|uniref:GLTP domain-containing protein n=1 Tax=Trichomonascus vanleenenianus TaxID=2268995 RepID=UPI003EC9F142
MSSTFFDKIRRDFKDVPIEDGKIATTEFLEAAESLVTLFDLFGNAAFKVVQNDMTGNVKKIRTRQLADPSKAETLQDIVLGEVTEKKKDATQGLLWLTRGLRFTADAMKRNLDNPSEELSVSFTESYNATLTKYHNMMIRPVFKLAMKACPYRKDLYEKLGEDQEKVLAQLKEWLDALLKIVVIIEEFLASGNYAKGL